MQHTNDEYYDDSPIDDPDNPEWTEDDFKRARPGKEVLEEHGVSLPAR